MKNKLIRFTLALVAFVFAVSASAQVTNASFTGTVKDGEGQKLSGAIVKAIHEPSGSVFTG